MTLATRNHKSTVFTMLFQNPENLLSLYNALNGSNYTDINEMQVVTLEKAIYMSMKNDTAYLLRNTLQLYEHQSTINPNMPLRFLSYVTREYEKLLAGKSIYGRKPLQLPAPNFVIFYNGTDKEAERKILKLSDLYIKPVKKINLELCAELININQGYNEKLKESCRILWEYSVFVEKVRENIRKKMEIKEAVEEAVKICIRENILKDFLLENHEEVLSVSIFEYDQEKELQLLRESEYNYGVEKGIEKGIVQGCKEERVRLLKNLLSNNIDLDIIKSLGYSDEEIQEMIPTQ